MSGLIWIYVQVQECDNLVDAGVAHLGGSDAVRQSRLGQRAHHGDIGADRRVGCVYMST